MENSNIYELLVAEAESMMAWLELNRKEDMDTILKQVCATC